MESIKKGGNIDQKIKERFAGINDPIAKKIIEKVKDVNIPEPPEDLNITTIFLGGIDNTIDEDDIKESLKAFGKIKQIKIVSK